MGRPREGWSLRPPRGKRKHYSVRFTDRSGTPREYATGTTDPEEAARVAAEIYARDLTAAPIAGPRINPHLPLDEHMSEWLASLATTHDRETVVTYTAHAKRFIEFFGNSLARITVARMGDYSRKRLGEVLKITVRKERSTLNVFLDWCEEQGLIAEEHRPKWPRLPKKALGVRVGPQRAKPVDVTPAQVNAFLAALPAWSRQRNGVSFAIRARFIVAYETGLRPATLDALEVPKHWRPGSTEILVDSQIDKARFGRKVPITARCAEALERTVLALGLKEGLIFGAHDHRWWVERARVQAGLPEEFAPYDLRHGRAGHLLDASGDMRAVAYLIGHLKLTTTDRYVRPNEAGARAALAAGSGDIPGTDAANDLGPEDVQEVTMRDDSAKEGGRTPTRVTSLVPESGAAGLRFSSYDELRGQEGSKSDSEGQGFGDVPETHAPRPLAAAAGFLTVLRAQWDALDAVSLSGDEDTDDAVRGSR